VEIKFQGSVQPDSQTNFHAARDAEFVWQNRTHRRRRELSSNVQWLAERRSLRIFDTVKSRRSTRVPSTISNDVGPRLWVSYDARGGRMIALTKLS
jgi:hypothetical protein